MTVHIDQNIGVKAKYTTQDTQYEFAWVVSDSDSFSGVVCDSLVLVVGMSCHSGLRLIRLNYWADMLTDWRFNGLARTIHLEPMRSQAVTSVFGLHQLAKLAQTTCEQLDRPCRAQIEPRSLSIPLLSLWALLVGPQISLILFLHEVADPWLARFELLHVWHSPAEQGVCRTKVSYTGSKNSNKHFQTAPPPFQLFPDIHKRQFSSCNMIFWPKILFTFLPAVSPEENNILYLSGKNISLSEISWRHSKEGNTIK